MEIRDLSDTEIQTIPTRVRNTDRTTDGVQHSGVYYAVKQVEF